VIPCTLHAVDTALAAIDKKTAKQFLSGFKIILLNRILHQKLPFCADTCNFFAR